MPVYVTAEYSGPQGAITEDNLDHWMVYARYDVRENGFGAGVVESIRIGQFLPRDYDDLEAAWAQARIAASIRADSYARGYSDAVKAIRDSINFEFDRMSGAEES